MKKITTSIIVFGFILIVNLSCTKKQETLYVDDCYFFQENLHKGTQIIVPSSIQNLYDFIYQYRATDPQKTDLFINELLTQSQKINFQHGIAKAHYMKGYVLDVHQAAYSKALKEYESALSLYESIGDQEGVAESYTSIGTTYYLSELYDVALISYAKALNWWKILGNKNQEANTYRGIAMVHSGKKDYENAIQNYKEALQIREKLGDEIGKAESYNDLGIVLECNNQFCEAIDYYNKSIQIAEKMGYKRQLADVYNNIAFIYKQQKLYTLSMECYLKSLTIEEELGNNNQGKVKNYYNIGITQLELNKPKEALDWLTKGKKLAEEIKDEKWIANLNEQLALAHYKLGNNTQAISLNKEASLFYLENNQVKMQLKKQKAATFLQSEDYKRVCESVYKENLKTKKSNL